MAKAKMNALIAGLSGSLDKDHYARTTKGGKTIISLKPDFSNRQSSEAQLNVQGGMKAAAAYGKVACKENPIYANLANGTDKNAYNVAIGDWFNAPVIYRIEWRQNEVRAIVNDDVLVTRVTVSILSEDGQCLAQGDAELQLGYVWVYASEMQGRIVVEAWDLPGNLTRQEFSPSSFASVWERTGRCPKPGI